MSHLRVERNPNTWQCDCFQKKCTGHWLKMPLRAKPKNLTELQRLAKPLRPRPKWKEPETHIDKFRMTADIPPPPNEEWIDRNSKALRPRQKFTIQPFDRSDVQKPTSTLEMKPPPNLDWLERNSKALRPRQKFKGER